MFDAVHSCIQLFTSTWRTAVGAEGLFPQTTLHMLTAQTTYSQVWAILVIPLGLQNDWDLMQGQQNIYKDGRKGPTRKLCLLLSDERTILRRAHQCRWTSKMSECHHHLKLPAGATTATGTEQDKGDMSRGCQGYCDNEHLCIWLCSRLILELQEFALFALRSFQCSGCKPHLISTYVHKVSNQAEQCDCRIVLTQDAL